MIELKEAKLNRKDKNHRRKRFFSKGFSLVELSVVLVVLAVITAAITSGGDLLRRARTQRLYTDFVFGWNQAFTQYTLLTRVVPGDDLLAPQNRIPGVLCNSSQSSPELTNIMLARGVVTPAGRAVGREDRYVYQDQNGQPHELRVCFMTRSWAVAGTSSGAYVLADRHVMRLTGLTIELASELDAMIDDRADARFGRFRSGAQASNVSTTGVLWLSGTVKQDAEAFVAETEAYLEM